MQYGEPRFGLSHPQSLCKEADMLKQQRTVIVRRTGIATVFLLVAAAAGIQEAQAQDWASVAYYRDANRALIRADPQRVVFLGDSITEGWAGDVLFHHNPHFIDRGISSQTAPQMLVRFRFDVVAL